MNNFFKNKNLFFLQLNPFTFLRNKIFKKDRNELRTLKAAFDRLEGGTTFDIYVESET